MTQEISMNKLSKKTKIAIFGGLFGLVVGGIIYFAVKKHLNGKDTKILKENQDYFLD